MYAQHFGFLRPPFSIAPDPRSLYMSESHREALAHLLFGLGGGGGFVLLTGEIGAGKTTVCRAFIEQIPKRCNVAYIFNPKLSAIELLQTVCEELRIPLPGGVSGEAIKPLVDGINEFLLRTHAVGQNTVLIIDEAQNLAPEVLEQLRLLTNLETSERKLLQIILIGQPELRTMLARPELEQLAQRVIARYHLGPLSADDTQRYIRHRQAVAGLSRPNVFARAAMKRVHALTGGVPRRINLLCDRALLGAYTLNAARVEVDTVNRAAAEVFDVRSPWQRLRALCLGRRERAVLAAVVGAVLLLAAGAMLWQNRAVARTAATRQSPTPLPHASLSASPTSPTTASAPALSASRPQGAYATVPPDHWPAVDGPASGGSDWPLLLQHWRPSPRQASAPATPGAATRGGAPCEAAWLDRLACLEGRATLEELRAMNRPTLLTLRDLEGNGQGSAVLTGLSADMAQLHAAGIDYRLPVLTVARLWTGQFRTAWRMDFDAGPRPSTHPPARKAWLQTRLALLQQQGALPDGGSSSVTAQLIAFQNTQGLPADGKPTPATLMRLNRAVGVAEPVLLPL
ncbi:MAG: hypothetical protein RJA98_1401 [Pseudomonadota bacterium]|jgi:general secretion pathway protein A